jgi:hypothetical protein
MVINGAISRLSPARSLGEVEAKDQQPLLGQPQAVPRTVVTKGLAKIISEDRFRPIVALLVPSLLAAHGLVLNSEPAAQPRPGSLRRERSAGILAGPRC